MSRREVLWAVILVPLVLLLFFFLGLTRRSGKRGRQLFRALGWE